MKKFFGEFKKFITRGNVLDMAVGVIVGGAFTAIVNGLTNFILKPLINALLALIFGDGSFDNAITILGKRYYTTDANGAPTLDLTKTIYIDWGGFISAIINFFLIAIVLFLIVKIINRIAEGNKKLSENIKKNTLNRKERKELKSAGVDIKDKEAVKAYFEQKEADALKAAEEEKLKKEEEERLEREQNPTTEDLLKLILAELKKES